MHRTIGYLSKRFAHIRPGEGQRVGFTFLYFFLVITAYYVIKPASRSLVLDDLGHRLVPYVDLITAVCMGPVVGLFARLVDRVTKPQLVTRAFLAVTAVMGGFWVLLSWPSVSWISGAFYVWVSIFSVLVVTLFWLVANDLYRPREAKRLFGFIGSGGIIGGIVGSSIAAAGAHLLGTRHLLLVSAGLLLLCWFVVQRLWRLAPQTPAPEQTLASHRHGTFLSDLRGFIRLLLSSRYLLLLVAIVGLNKLVTTFIYYQFNPFIESTFPDVDQKTTFTGIFFGAINVVAFLVQFFCTSWVLRRWGLLTGLLVMPLGLLVGTGSLLVLPLFWLAACTELYDRSLDYSLNNSAKEVLYLPIDRSVRYKVKPFIDMVVFRLGKGVAAVTGIVLLDWLNLPARVLTAVTVPLVFLWMFAAVRMRREYTATIRTVLQARATRRPGAASPGADGEGARALGGTLAAPRQPQRKLSLITQLVNGSRDADGHGKMLLTGLTSYEEPLSSLLPGESVIDAGRLKAIIQDQQRPIPLRRQAIQVLARPKNQDALDYLCGMLIVEEEAVLRDEVLRQVVAVRLSRRGLQVPGGLVRRQVEREVQEYGRIRHVAGIYRQHHRGPVAPDDPVLGLLRALLEESVERIFRLLMLLYRPEDIQLIYEQMRAEEVHLRADAIELLDNLVDAGLRGAIVPILDEDSFLAITDDATDALRDPAVAYRILREAIWGPHCWLSVTTLCAIGRLGLTSMRQELEQAARHTAPLVASAARVVLCVAPFI